MADGMADYLRSTNLFGRTGGNMPKLTLGGYLLRRHRLLALKSLLSVSEQAQLDAAVAKVDALLSQNIVRSEAKAQQEVEARLRQWQANVADIRRDAKAFFHTYPTVSETRTMLAHLLDMLSSYPYQVDEELGERLELIDVGLRNLLQTSEYVGPEEWDVAYPRDEYWWLYGRPRTE